MAILRITAFVAFCILMVSCGRKTDPHRVPTPPFETISDYERSGDLIDRAEFAYVGKQVELVGVIEIDRKTDTISLKGEYITRQALREGAQLAIQIYNENGKMLARDLPRIPLEKDGQETLVASLNETFGPSNWGLGFEDDDVLIQFNYIQEGEFWYDIEYPDIELPSIVAQNINSLERFDVRWELIPRIMPRGVVNYLPAVIDAKNRGTTPFHYLTAVESFTATDLERIEQLRNQIESGFSLVSDKKLMMNSLKVDRTGSYFVRNGFVWDGVRWDGSAPPEGYKRIWIVPSWVYLAGIATILATLFLVWNRLGNVRSLPARSGIKVAIFLGALSLALIATTNGMIGLFTMLLAAPVIAYRRWPIKIRRYVLAVGLFSLLEIYWGGLFANSENTIGAILISVALYCLAALPLLYIRKHLYSFAIFVLLTIIVSTNYAIQDLYYTFFNDYASVRMLGYAYQVPQIADSIVELLGDDHWIMVVIAAWYGVCVWVCPMGKK